MEIFFWVFWGVLGFLAACITAVLGITVVVGLAAVILLTIENLLSARRLRKLRKQSSKQLGLS